MSDSTNNMKYWEMFCTPPAEVLSTIEGGRLNGKTDINPQWRIKAMTEQFGPIGEGWKYEHVDRWREDDGEEISVYVMINLYYRDSEEWSAPIPGIGGSMLRKKEGKALYHSDECYKMATTDALSVAMKQIGVAADIYMGKGNLDPSKYGADKPTGPGSAAISQATEEQIDRLEKKAKELEKADDKTGAAYIRTQIDAGLDVERADMLIRRQGA